MSLTKGGQLGVGDITAEHRERLDAAVLGAFGLGQMKNLAEASFIIVPQEGGGNHPKNVEEDPLSIAAPAH